MFVWKKKFHDVAFCFIGSRKLESFETLAFVSRKNVFERNSILVIGVSRAFESKFFDEFE